MSDAFDADCLIFAAIDHPLGGPVRRLIEAAPGSAGIGSVLLRPEVLIKPMRTGAEDELRLLMILLGKLDLQAVSTQIVDAAVGLGARHGLKTVDAVHLATAVVSGANRFITNNRRDFPGTISEIQIVYPDMLEA